MSKLSSVSVDMSLTVETKPKHFMKLGLSAERVFDADEGSDIHAINSLREDLSILLREGLYKEIEKVYGSETVRSVMDRTDVGPMIRQEVR